MHSESSVFAAGASESKANVILEPFSSPYILWQRQQIDTWRWVLLPTTNRIPKGGVWQRADWPDTSDRHEAAINSTVLASHGTPAIAASRRRIRKAYWETLHGGQ